MRDPKKEKKKLNKMKVVVGVLILTLIGVSLFAFVPWSTLFPPEEQVPASTVKLTSTFTLIDYRTGEDVSAWVEVSVWTPDSDDLPFDADDAQTITNFDEEETSTDAEDVAIDLRDHAVAWLEVDPDFESDYGGYDAGVLYGDGVVTQSRDFRKLIGGGNFDYRVYVYHIPTNVSVVMYSRGDMDGTGFPYMGDAEIYNNTCNAIGTIEHGTDGTYTVVLNMPYDSAHGLHAGDTGGDEWDMDADELAEIVADAAVHTYDIDYESLWLEDQSNHRTIAPLYDLTDDTEKDYLSTLEKFTNCFTIRLTMNMTISQTDADDAQINVTIMQRDNIDVPADVIVHGEFIDIVFYEPIVCYNHYYNFDLRLEFADHIHVDSVTTNRQITPSDRNNLGAVTLLNTMQLYPLALD